MRMNGKHLHAQACLAHRIEKHPFRFAKTMPENPHWYTLRKEWDNEEFDDAVRDLRAFGRISWFKGYPYVGWNANGFYYWTMGAPIHKTILINRKPIQEEHPYDHIALQYSTIYQDVKERSTELQEILQIKPDHSVLEIGCRTGILQDILQKMGVACEYYIGFDPSPEMINIARQKHAQVNYRVGDLESIFYRQQFDRVILPFDVPNQIDPLYLQKIEFFLKSGGEAVLIWRREGAAPRITPTMTPDVETYPTTSECTEPWDEEYQIERIYS